MNLQKIRNDLRVFGYAFVEELVGPELIERLKEVCAAVNPRPT